MSCCLFILCYNHYHLQDQYIKYKRTVLFLLHLTLANVRKNNNIAHVHIQHRNNQLLIFSIVLSLLSNVGRTPKTHNKNLYHSRPLKCFPVATFYFIFYIAPNVQNNNIGCNHSVSPKLRSKGCAL